MLAEPLPLELREAVARALRQSYLLGQLYWQQADSDFTSYHKKADVTQAKFNHLVFETLELLSGEV